MKSICIFFSEEKAVNVILKKFIFEIIIQSGVYSYVSKLYVLLYFSYITN